jgi:hypothetical protein
MAITHDDFKIGDKTIYGIGKDLMYPEGHFDKTDLKSYHVVGYVRNKDTDLSQKFQSNKIGANFYVLRSNDNPNKFKKVIVTDPSITLPLPLSKSGGKRKNIMQKDKS